MLVFHKLLIYWNPNHLSVLKNEHKDKMPEEKCLVEVNSLRSNCLDPTIRQQEVNAGLHSSVSMHTAEG